MILILLMYEINLIIMGKPRIIFAGVVLSLILLSGITVTSYSDYLSPKKQIESGVLPEDVVCKVNKILVIRDNGSPACVSEKTAEKKGWMIIVAESTEPLAASVSEHSELQDTVSVQDSVKINEESVNVAQTHAVSVSEHSELQDTVSVQDSVKISEESVNVAQTHADDDVVSGTTTVTLNIASPVEFVDDGREYPSVLQRRPPSPPIYDKVMAAELVFPSSDVSGETSRSTTFTSVPHTKYSKNPGVGLYIEDWMPTHILDGYRLLYANTGYSEYKSGRNVHYVGYYFVPTDFVIQPDATYHTLYRNSDGYHAVVEISNVQHDEIEDIKEKFRESRESQSGNYGGFREMTRDGKTVDAYAGGNDLNYYTSNVAFAPDEYSLMRVNSAYHTLDELIPVFESMMN